MGPPESRPRKRVRGDGAKDKVRPRDRRRDDGAVAQRRERVPRLLRDPPPQKPGLLVAGGEFAREDEAIVVRGHDPGNPVRRHAEELLLRLDAAQGHPGKGRQDIGGHHQPQQRDQQVAPPPFWAHSRYSSSLRSNRREITMKTTSEA